MPEAYDEFVRIGQQLESHYRNVQDLEFTIERGRLYMLQTRDAKRTAAAAVKIAVDMVDEGTITKEEAVARIEPAQVDQLLRDTFDPAALKGAKKIVNGLNASPGAAVGRAVFDADTAVEWVERGEKVILVRIETSPDDFHGMAVSEGIITARGGATSHAAVVARQIGKPCVAGSADLIVDYAGKQAHCNVTGTDFKEGDWVSLDGSTGALYLGRASRPCPRGSRTSPSSSRSSAGPTGSAGWASGPTPTSPRRPPRPAATARRASACAAPSTCSARATAWRSCAAPSSSPTSPPAPRPRRAAGDALTADEQEAVATFDAAMAKLEVLQQGDFEGIFKAMDGLPVVIRLIDPPLHEFLPNLEEQLVKVTRAEEHGGASEEDKQLLATIKSLHEQNPMLGLRGCRLGLMIPDFVKIQTRAILNAQIAVRKAGGNPIAKIMIPLVGHVNELSATRALLEAEAEAVREAAGGIDVDYKFGTMIEVPRGALTADEIADHADFFSFGTNDLTQMTFGYSRDDAEGGFLLKYVEDGILPVNPFQTLDDAVAGLMKMAVDKGRATKPGPRARHLRRARRRPGVDPQVRADRARLRVLLAVPRPGRPPRRRAGRAHERRRERQVGLRPAPTGGPPALPGERDRVGDRRAVERRQADVPVLDEAARRQRNRTHVSFATAVPPGSAAARAGRRPTGPTRSSRAARRSVVVIDEQARRRRRADDRVEPGEARGLARRRRPRTSALSVQVTDRELAKNVSVSSTNGALFVARRPRERRPRPRRRPGRWAR